MNTTKQGPASTAESNRQFLSFNLQGRIYATPIEPIREIIEVPTLTELPLAPPTLRGVINLRGAVVPVIDLAVRFGGNASVLGKRSCVVVIESRHEEGLQPVGFIVDGVNEVIDVEPEQLEARPDFGLGFDSSYASHMIGRAGRFIVALDMDQVLGEGLASWSSLPAAA